MLLKIAAQSIVSQLAPSGHVKGVQQRDRAALGAPHAPGASNTRKLECVYPNKRRKGSASNSHPGDGTDNGEPREKHPGHFSEMVFAANSLSQDPSADKSTMKPPAPPSALGSGRSLELYGHAALIDSYSQPPQPVSGSSRLLVADDTLPPSLGHAQPESQFPDGPVATQFDTDFAGVLQTYDYNTFEDEPLNWIPPSLIPSPYDAELEQDFSFILPSLSTEPTIGTEYNIAVPFDPNSQVYQVQDVSPETSDSHNFPAAFIGMEASPSSSASDGLNMARSANTISSTDPKRKKRKMSHIPESFNTPRNQQSSFAFPPSSDSASMGTSGDPSGHVTYSTYQTIRDLFQILCLDTRGSRKFAQSDFPTVADFNTCTGLYFEHFHHGFPLVHRPSFGPQTRMIVVLAVATIGSNFLKTQRALDFRDACQEFLRRAIHHYSDGIPDSDPLDVPLAQARILNLVALLQSDRDQLRCLAPRYHADLSQWCLASGILQVPDVGDFSDTEEGPLIHGESLDAWQSWIQRESLRRVGYLAWLLDCCLGYMANARPLCNMDDARTPLPCMESAWEAPTVDLWMQAMGQSSKTPSLCVALETLYKNKKVGLDYSELSQVLLIHALYLRTWEVGTHIKQPLSEWVPTGKARGFLNTPSKDNFWLPLYPLYANWRNSACDCLDVLTWHASSVVAHASGVEHQVMLHLHLARIVLLTPFQEIQDLLFSLIGKVGNSPVASFYVHDGSYQPRNKAKLPQIRKITWRWLREDQHKARLAMIHAGSVFWYVRRYSAMSFYEPVAVYLASLVLWTYGSYKSSALDRDAAAGTAANQRPEGGPSGPDAGAAIQPSRVERKERQAKFMNKSTAHHADRQLTSPPHATFVSAHENRVDNPATSLAQDSSDADSDDTSSSDERPEFIHLDRPCDDEIIQHFVRNGQSMAGYMTNVGNICETPQKVLLEGAKLLRTRLACWGVSREYYDILMKLAELRKAG
ncbi:hypothetical protein PV08_05434 [Exophiala spinifera]|uniref:Xylanolytic transcriptional activator regulatory domain-containing protein n=1 Tax=Exophiala spinifera TaxID=91928 RepID=A0A0D2B901_9EURO|nr:uncharacterized protein PV08_05434 [Exophiala spinifera]KIW15388.1 hypothetical protein PV08_05434 [Exophiala spinifera]